MDIRFEGDDPSDSTRKIYKHLSNEAYNEISEKTEKRFASLKSAYGDFIKNPSLQDVNEYFYLNDKLLLHAINLYFNEIYAFKINSHIEFINKEKKCAYMIKWINKIKPIQIKENDSVLSEKIIYINSLFAVWAGFIHIFGIKKLKIIMSNNYYEILIHKLHSENINTDQLLLIISALVKDYKN